MLKICKVISLVILFALYWSPANAKQDVPNIKTEINELIEKSNDVNKLAQQRISYVEKALVLAQEIDCDDYILMCKSEIGIIYLGINEYDLAHKYLSETLALAIETNNKAEEAAANYLLGNLHGYLENSNEAIKHYNEFIRINKNLKDTVAYGFILNGIGIVYVKQGKLDSAKNYFLESKAILSNLNNKYGISYPLNNLGDYHLRMGNNDSALYYFQKAYSNDSTYNNLKGISLLNCNIGLVYSNKKEYNKAIHYFKQCLNISIKYEYRKITYDCYRDISEMYERKGKIDSSLSYFHKYSILKDSVLNIEITNRILNYQKIVENEKKEKALLENQSRIDLLNANQKILRYKLLIFIFGFLLVLTISIIVFIKQRNEINSKKQILKKNIELQKVREELNMAQIDFHKKEKENIERELKQKKKDLLSFGLNIARQNKFNNEIKVKVKQIIKGSSDGYQNSLKDILFYVQNNDQINNDLSLFQDNVEKINNEFFFNLSSQFPSLSKNEKNLCGMIRLGLTSKEIAVVRNISPTSIEVARYRLRKKLNLNTGEKLSSFIKNL